MEKSRMIIIEGPQGTGKTTLANFLRDNIAGSNLYRLSGQRDKSKSGLDKSIKMYDALLDYLKRMEDVPMDMIFDRTFMTEEVYARLGYKDYSFTEQYQKYAEMLNNLNYDIYYITLYLKQINLYEKRLARDSHHNYQAFSVNNSINQQNTYLTICDELEKYDNINTERICMDEFDSAYCKVKTLFDIKNK